jgi:hypothetical protein
MFSMSGGGVHVVDTKSGKLVTSLGAPGDSLDGPIALKFQAGVIRVQSEENEAGPWLTQKSPPGTSEFEPPQPKGARSSIARTEGYVFALDQARGTRTLTVYEKSGKQVRTEALPDGETMQSASKGVTLLRTTGCLGMVCEADKPCRKFDFKGYVANFRHPWALVHSRGFCPDPQQTRLLNIEDGRTQDFTSCRGANIVSFDRAGNPQVLCNPDEKKHTALRLVDTLGNVLRTFPNSRIGSGAFEAPFLLGDGRGEHSRRACFRSALEHRHGRGGQHFLFASSRNRSVCGRRYRALR